MNPFASGVVGPALLQTGPWDGNMCNGSRDCIPQAGTTSKLDAIADQNVMYRAAYRSFGDHESLVINHTVDATGTDTAGIRWYQIDNLQDSPVIVAGATTYSPDATNRWMGTSRWTVMGTSLWVQRLCQRSVSVHPIRGQARDGSNRPDGTRRNRANGSGVTVRG